jgi:hypothetical protein
MALSFNSGCTGWKRKRVELSHQLWEADLELVLLPTQLCRRKVRICCTQSRMGIHGTINNVP